MGIHNLLKYIQKYNTKNYLQYESGNNIYISSIVYIDLSTKLVDIYEGFISESCEQKSSDEDNIFENNVDKLLTFATQHLKEYISKYHKNATRIYVFADRKVQSGITIGDVLFKDFLKTNFNSHDVLKGNVMIKRKYVDAINSCNLSDQMYRKILSSVRNMYELVNIYSMSTENVLHKYISVQYAMKQTANEQAKELYRRIYDEGINRYIILRKSKYRTKHKRMNDKMNRRLGTKSIHSNVNAIILESSNSELSIFNYNKFVPFSVLIYMLPKIISEIHIPNVQFFECNIESDYAIANHIDMYSKNAFPTIITSDTDMVALLCDVNCIIKLIPRRMHSLQINPLEFWHNVFGINMNERVIKIACVLLGSDYNPYDSSSPIHIATLDELRQFAAVKSFEDITEEMLLTKIYLIMNDHPNETYTQQTAIALNMYLKRFEQAIHYISPDECVNLNKFIKISKMDCLYVDN